MHHWPTWESQQPDMNTDITSSYAMTSCYAIMLVMLFWIHLKTKILFSGIGISIMKIKLSWDHFIFIMGIPIPENMTSLYWNGSLLDTPASNVPTHTDSTHWWVSARKTKSIANALEWSLSSTNPSISLSQSCMLTIYILQGFTLSHQCNDKQVGNT